ncbi:MAG: chorismate-binding protein [Brumimicrobium sp.]|nr:chorismate-binding protein [Brumimicrobium sp.]
MGILAYQFPNQTLKIFQGNWKRSSLDELPKDTFFVSSFTKDEVYYFEMTGEIESIPSKELTLGSKNDIFIVNDKSYLFGLEHFKFGFEPVGISKAIYSRIKFKEGTIDKLEDILRVLASKYQQEALVYLISDTEFGTWMGATPEILLEGDEEEMRTIALAGTKDTEERRWTVKEEEEHQYVVSYVGDIISKYAQPEIKQSSTETVKNGAVYHLKTKFSFKVAYQNWNELLKELHPTPAVCGTPKEIAQRYILTYEPHERKFYTGLIGMKQSDSLSVFVNLRCMQILQEGFGLYVGGGITKDSRIEDEWMETEAKSKTLISVIEEVKE